MPACPLSLCRLLLFTFWRNRYNLGQRVVCFFPFRPFPFNMHIPCLLTSNRNEPSLTVTFREKAAEMCTEILWLPTAGWQRTAGAWPLWFREGNGSLPAQKGSFLTVWMEYAIIVRTGWSASPYSSSSSSTLAASNHPWHNRREEERETPLGGVSGSRRGARGRWAERGLMERCLRGAAGARAPLPWRPLCLAAPVAGPGTRSGCGRGQAEAGRARLRLSPFSAPGMAGSAPRRVSASSLSFAPPAAARGSGVP